ncbi:MAG TPA: branched-chain amino acid ABC transporter permease [Tissierellaceae bacterium]
MRKKGKKVLNVIFIVVLYLLIQMLISIGIIDSFYELNIVIICINIILAVSLNLITGITGQFSLGHAAFMSIGAYTSAILTAKFNLPFILALFISGFAASLAGIMIGLPTLRLKGDYLAIATLGFGEIVKVIATNTDYIGGAIGFNDIPRYTNWTWVYISVTATVILVKRFVNSYHGRACRAVKEDEIAAESVGINTTFYKALAFAIGAFYAGVAGSLYANYFYFIKPDSFGFMKSIDILITVVFGGIGNIIGSIIGAVSLSIISLSLQDIAELRMVIYSVVLYLIMIYRNNGMFRKRGFKIFKNRKKVKYNVGVISK